ncbi:MAG TPA: TIGR03915 family putative DNA repair protein [Candidatus Hydrogenedentes bacterium]|nr:TIGR03915 family putative DNA repair protein [Candidatus Hydrogenedentota bacterium]HPG69285.1 TIGR03915 family putative DNA repair protein [Candidatus Hydrogenedentota bacterium]
MKTYAYDGSFEGLMTAFQAALDEGVASPTFEAAMAGRDGWLLDIEPVETDAEAAQDLCRRLRSAGGVDTLRCLIYAYLADTERLEHAMFEFARLTLDHGCSVAAWRHNDAVAEVQRWADKVSREVHRFAGLLRFKKLRDGAFYAAYAPDHNITQPLARHFRERLRAQRWVIHDRKRDIAVAWDGDRLRQVVETPADIDALLADDERDYQRLWRLFAETIAIRNRANPRLQRQFMPQRYWAYLPEMTAR